MSVMVAKIYESESKGLTSFLPCLQPPCKVQSHHNNSVMIEIYMIDVLPIEGDWECCEVVQGIQESLR